MKENINPEIYLWKKKFHQIELSNDDIIYNMEENEAKQKTGRHMGNNEDGEDEKKDTKKGG